MGGGDERLTRVFGSNVRLLSHDGNVYILFVSWAKVRFLVSGIDTALDNSARGFHVCVLSSSQFLDHDCMSHDDVIWKAEDRCSF